MTHTSSYEWDIRAKARYWGTHSNLRDVMRNKNYRMIGRGLLCGKKKTTNHFRASCTCSSEIAFFSEWGCVRCVWRGKQEAQWGLAHSCLYEWSCRLQGSVLMLILQVLIRYTMGFQSSCEITTSCIATSTSSAAAMLLGLVYFPCGI